MFSTYDKKASSTNTFNQLTNEDTISCALNALFTNESEYIDALVIGSGLTETEVREILRDSLTIDSKLIIKSTRACSHKNGIKNHSKHNGSQKNNIKFIIASTDFAKAF